MWLPENYPSPLLDDWRSHLWITDGKVFEDKRWKAGGVDLTRPFLRKWNFKKLFIMKIFKHIFRYINITMNSYVLIAQPQQWSIHGQSYFIQTSLGINSWNHLMYEIWELGDGWGRTKRRRSEIKQNKIYFDPQPNADSCWVVQFLEIKVSLRPSFLPNLTPISLPFSELCESKALLVVQTKPQGQVLLALPSFLDRLCGLY